MASIYITSDEEIVNMELPTICKDAMTFTLIAVYISISVYIIQNEQRLYLCLLHNLQPLNRQHQNHHQLRRQYQLLRYRDHHHASVLPVHLLRQHQLLCQDQLRYQLLLRH